MLKKFKAVKKGSITDFTKERQKKLEKKIIRRALSKRGGDL